MEARENIDTNNIVKKMFTSKWRLAKHSVSSLKEIKPGGDVEPPPPQ